MSFALYDHHEEPPVLGVMYAPVPIYCPCSDDTLAAVRASLRAWARPSASVAEEAGVGLRTAQDALAWLARDGEAVNEGGKWRSA